MGSDTTTTRVPVALTLAEQRTCNASHGGSIPLTGSTYPPSSIAAARP